jgi:DNA invertase Pin-like site-specific DNA recombinase
MKIGYTRVSAADQDTATQIAKLKAGRVGRPGGTTGN